MFCFCFAPYCTCLFELCQSQVVHNLLSFLRYSGDGGGVGGGAFLVLWFCKTKIKIIKCITLSRFKLLWKHIVLGYFISANMWEFPLQYLMTCFFIDTKKTRDRHFGNSDWSEERQCNIKVVELSSVGHIFWVKLNWNWRARGTYWKAPPPHEHVCEWVKADLRSEKGAM